MSIQAPRRRRGPRAEPFSEAGIEPSLEDLLSDPVTAAVMRCDGVSPASLRALISSARSTLQTRTAVS
jgi:hypothetical protein